MNTYKHGGRGLELLIPGFIRDLEGRTENSWDFLWGAVGAPVASMESEEVVLWMEEIGAPPEVVDLQRKDRNRGKDIHEYVSQSLTDSGAITKMMSLFKTTRKPALRMLMNLRLRERKSAEAGTMQRPLLETIREVISILTEMKKLGHGRYHGAHEFAKKFSCNRGIDVLMQIIRTADDDSCLAALWALTLINDSAEERHYETSVPEALNRYEKRKLIIKANGINTMMHVLENRSDAARELALHLLQAIMSFPQHWLGFSGWPMTTYYNDGQMALLRGCLKTILKVLDQSPSNKVKLKCLALITEFMSGDDVDVDRHTSTQLEPSFFIDPKSRSRCNTPSSASSQKSQRFSMFQRLKTGDEYEDDIGIDDDESSTCLARDTLLREGGAQLLARVIQYKQVGGKLKIHHLSAAGLPKSDMLGESDPYLRVFLGDKEVRTEIIMDTSKPAWKKVIEFEVEDVAEACLYIMCYDWEEYGDHQFIAMTVIHLADVVADALENGQMVRLDKILESELFVRIQSGRKARPVRNADTIVWDEWLPLRFRTGMLPKLKGQLGSLHLHLELHTQWQYDQEVGQVHSNALAALHLLYAHPDTRHLCDAHSLSGPVMRLLKSSSDEAVANAAAVLSHMAFDRRKNKVALDAGATDALLVATNYGSMATKRRCLEALSLFALDPQVRDEMLVVRGHLGATSDIVTPVVDAMLREDVDDEVTSAALALLINLATEAPRRVPEAIINSRAPDILLKIVFSGRADVRAEAACLIALLVANPEYRRHMSLLTGRSGDQTFNICRALSTALVAKDSITDARAKTGAYDTRSAACAALVYLARFGGLSELAYAMAVGDQDIKVEAAAALAHVAADVNERDNVVGIPGLVANLVEMIVLANDTRSRLTATLVLARVSEGDESEKSDEIRRRVIKICEEVPQFGFTPIDPLVDICLRSIDDTQRAVAAQTLACWVMVPEYAADIWSRGADLILDLCMVDPRRCKDGQWYGVQLLAGCCEHVHMRETVAVYEVMLDGKSISTMKAMRQVLRNCDKETCIECSLVLKQVWAYGGLEELVDALMKEDGDLHAMKSVCTVLQPLCAKPPVRNRVGALSGKHPDEVGMWMAKYIYAQEQWWQQPPTTGI